MDEFRIIPTRMGTSAINAFQGSQTVGSSPRVWGQEKSIDKWSVMCWIIPTRMGTRIHDRCISYSKKGSSPRVWGQADLHPLY